MKKSKLSPDVFLLLKASKILNNFYKYSLAAMDRDCLTKEEIINEAKSVIRKWDDCPFLINMSFYSALEKSDWEKLAAMKP
jgi:hypothetical protein